MDSDHKPDPSPILGYELQFYRELPAALMEELNQARELGDTVLSIFGEQVTIPDKIERRVAHTVLALIAKITKTCRAIEVACAIGADKDAVVLARTASETAAAIEYIIAPELPQVDPPPTLTPPDALPTSRLRALSYWAYMQNSGHKQLEAWKANPDSFGRWTGELETVRLKSQADLDELAKQLPDRSWERHWSGSGTLKGAVETLVGGAQWYKTLYAFLSWFAHGNDFAAHMTHGDDGLGIDFAPSTQHSKLALVISRHVLWHAAVNVCTPLAIAQPARLQSLNPGVIANGLEQ